MTQYPYNSPQILSDSVFVLYGGNIGTSTSFQRQAAFLLAEEQMTEHLSSFLLPTIITGSAERVNGTVYELDYGHVQNVLRVTIVALQNTNPYTTKTYTGTASIVSQDYGYINIYTPAMYGIVQSISAVYESGLATGTYTNPAVLTALTMAAQINLNEMDVSLSNESTADVGVQSFSNQSYSELRTKLGTTSFGNSAMSQRVARLVKKYRSKPALSFHR